MTKHTQTIEELTRTNKLLWIGYISILIMLIISLYFNVSIGSDTEAACEKMYKPLLDQVRQDPTFNYDLNFTIGGLQNEAIIKEPSTS